MRRRLIGLVAVTLLTVACASADAATSARVTIRDTSIAPGAVQIDVPGTVTWTNYLAKFTGSVKYVFTPVS